MPSRNSCDTEVCAALSPVTLASKRCSRETEDSQRLSSSSVSPVMAPFSPADGAVQPDGSGASSSSMRSTSSRASSARRVARPSNS